MRNKFPGLRWFSLLFLASKREFSQKKKILVCFSVIIWTFMNDQRKIYERSCLGNFSIENHLNLEILRCQGFLRAFPHQNLQVFLVVLLQGMMIFITSEIKHKILFDFLHWIQKTLISTQSKVFTPIMISQLSTPCWFESVYFLTMVKYQSSSRERVWGEK